jgi:hypothetical protein
MKCLFWKQILNKSIANLFLCLVLNYRLAIIGLADDASSKLGFASAASKLFTKDLR